MIWGYKYKYRDFIQLSTYEDLDSIIETFERPINSNKPTKFRAGRLSNVSEEAIEISFSASL